MNEKKKITHSVHRPDFKIYQIAKLEGVRTGNEERSRDRFSSPIFGRKVPDKIVVPEVNSELSDTGKRFDAFRDTPRIKPREDYSEFNIISDETRTKVLGGRKYYEEEKFLPKTEDIKPKEVKSIVDEVKKMAPIFEKVEEEETTFEDKAIDLTPIEEDVIPTPELHKSNNFQTKANFEDFIPKDEVVKTEFKDKSVYKKYVKPNPKMFKISKAQFEQEPEWLKEHTNIINETLDSFKVDGYVIGQTKGPTVTRYELSLSPGVNVNRIMSISDNLQMNLESTSIRIEAPIPGKPYVGLEVPNKEPEIVSFGNVVNTKEFLDDNEPLKVALGVDIDNENVYVDIAKMPHGLIAGATNSGKSVSVNTVLASLLIKNTPDDLKLILIDPKIVELSAYNDLPHLLTPVITEAKIASQALKWVVDEMEDRYKLFSENRSRDIKGYNESIKLGRINAKKMPYIVIIIDELADLMNVAAADVELSIQRITQKARAAGIHLIVATQRPTTDIVKGTIKSNIPFRIAFRVSSYVDSTTILDGAGAEKLLGKGDMLIKGPDRLIRLQGAYITDDEIYELTDFIKAQAEPEYEILHEELYRQRHEKSFEKDELFEEVAYFVVNENVASINRITSEFNIGFNRAQSIITSLEQYGIVSENQGTKSRDVLVTTIDELERILNDDKN